LNPSQCRGSETKLERPKNGEEGYKDNHHARLVKKRSPGDPGNLQQGNYREEGPKKKKK